MVHRQMLVHNVENLSQEYFEHAFAGHLLPAAKLAFSTMLERVLTPGGWRRQLYLGDQLHRLSMPVGFIWGHQDAFESPDTGRPKAAAIPNHTFAVVENAGHCPWLDQPAECTRLILEMLGD